MVLSALYFLDAKGRPILFRDYRGDIDEAQGSIDRFMLLLAEREEDNSLSPVIDDPKSGLIYVYTKINDLYGMRARSSFVHVASASLPFSLACPLLVALLITSLSPPLSACPLQDQLQCDDHHGVHQPGHPGRQKRPSVCVSTIPPPASFIRPWCA